MSFARKLVLFRHILPKSRFNLQHILTLGLRNKIKRAISHDSAHFKSTIYKNIYILKKRFVFETKKINFDYYLLQKYVILFKLPNFFTKISPISNFFHLIFIQLYIPDLLFSLIFLFMTQILSRFQHPWIWCFYHNSFIGLHFFHFRRDSFN